LSITNVTLEADIREEVYMQTKRYVVPIVGGLALAAAVFNGALAAKPEAFRDLGRSQAKTTFINGNLTVANIAHVNKNMSVYGHLYAHNGEQVWSGLLVRSGGVKADSLDVTGPMAAQSATIANNLTTGTLQATTINGTTLALSGAGTVGGALNVAGKVTGNGVDAGAGGLSTTGNIAAAGITASNQISAASITTNGAMSAGAGTFTNLTVTGNVNLTNASVTGLSVSNLSGATVGSLNIGTPSGTAPPLNVSENGKTANLGVDANGALTLGSALLGGNLGVSGNSTLAGTLAVSGAATVGGTLAVAGSGGITATGLTAPPSSSTTTTPGALTLTGNAINLVGGASVSGGLTLGNGSDLSLSTPSGSSASHVTASGDTDVAGNTTVVVPASTAANIDVPQTVAFKKVYAAAPVVVVSATTDPNPISNAAPKVWVTVNSGTVAGTYAGFTIHYVTAAATTGGFQVSYAYHVIGS